MPTKPIDRLMFAQGNQCFFCNMPLPRDEASVEHLVPSSRAGSNSDDNCVACCKTMNALLGSMSLKEKIKVVLNQKGHFKCPKAAASSTQEVESRPGAHVVAAKKPAPMPSQPVAHAKAASASKAATQIKPPSLSKAAPQTKATTTAIAATPSKPATPPKPITPVNTGMHSPTITTTKSSAVSTAPMSSSSNGSSGDSSTHRIPPETISRVLENLKTRGNARPRHLASLRATLKATASFKLTETQVDILIQHLRASGKIAVTNEMVAYQL